MIIFRGAIAIIGNHKETCTMVEYDHPVVHEMLRALPHGTPPVYPDGCDGVVDHRWISVAVITAYSADPEGFDKIA